MTGQWETAPLGYLARVRPSGVDKKAAAGERSVRLCNYTDIYYHDHITSSMDFMAASATVAEWQRLRLQPGDVAITKDSETADDIGIPAIVVDDLDDVVLGYHNSLIRADTRRLEPRFLFWVLRSTTAAAYFEPRARGITRVGLRSEDVASMPIQLPSLDLQRRVADFLDAETARIDTLIDKNEAAHARLHERLRGVVATTVTVGLDGQTRDADLGWTGRLKADWPLAPYQYVARTGSGHTPSRSEPSYWVDCDIPWITTADVGRLRSWQVETLDDTEHHISDLGIQNSSARLHPKGTVVLSRTASVGFSAIMGRDMATSQDFFTWTCDDRLLPEYLLYVLRAMKFRGLFDRLMYGSTHKTIYVPDLMELRGPLPPVDEQHRVVEHIRRETSVIFELMDRVRNLTAVLRERREALITAAVTGQIDV